jgi:hypothetical protein
LVAVSSSEYDLVIEPPGEDPLGLMLYRPPRRGKDGGIGPFGAAGSLLTDEAPQAQRWVRQDYDDFSAGSFYSRRIVPNGHAWTENGDASVPGVFLPSGLLTEMDVPTAAEPVDSNLRNCRSSVEYQGNLYFGAGRYVLKLAGGSGEPTIERDCGSGAFIRSMVVFQDSVYVSGAGMNLTRLLNTSWTTAIFGRRYLDVVMWTTADHQAWRLVGTNTVHGVNYTEANPPFTDTQWTPELGASDIPIGNSATDITAIVAAPRHVFFIKPDTGIHSLDSRGYAPALTPYWRHANTLDNSATPAIIHDGYLYAATKQGLDRLNVQTEGLRQDQPGWCSPGYGQPNETPVQGEVTALTVESGWVVAAVYNGIDTYLCWGQDRQRLNLDGPGPMVWYTKVRLPGEIVYHMRPAVVNSQPRLWICSNAAGTFKLRWLSLPRGGNPVQDLLNGGQHRFATSCTLYTSMDQWGNSAARKTMRRLGITSERLDTVTRLGIDMLVDGGAAVEQGEVVTSPYHTFLTERTQGYHFGFRVRGTGTTTAPPILRGLVPRADVYVEQDDLRIYQTVVGPGVTLKNGAVDDRDPGMVFERLRGLAELGPLTVRDELGTELEAIIQPAMPWETTEAPTPGHPIQRVVTLTMSVVEEPFYYDSGARWDSGKVWG